MKEVWKNIQGYEGFYQVSNLGRVKSLTRTIIKSNCKQTINERILSPAPSGGKNNDYLAVRLCSKDKVCQTHNVHRLVAVAFVPNPMNLPEVNHIGVDENGRITKLDNRAISLEWATTRENSWHHHRRVTSTSKFVGVSYGSEARKWQANMMINRRKCCIGWYDTEEEANIAILAKQTELGIINKYATYE